MQRQEGWRRSVRWFLAEFIVVVSGILVALAAQAWYSGARDSHLERGYVRQLISDLDATSQTLQLAVTQDSLRMRANLKYSEALHQPHAPSADSAQAWFDIGPEITLDGFSDPRPLLGTVTTLIQTGDIKLIQGQAVRSKIVAYAAWMSADMDELGRSIGQIHAASDDERRHWEEHGLVTPLGSWYTHDDGGEYREYLAAWPIIMNDAAVRSAVRARFIVFKGRVWYLKRMQKSTNDLSKVLRKEYSL